MKGTREFSRTLKLMFECIDVVEFQVATAVLFLSLALSRKPVSLFAPMIDPCSYFVRFLLLLLKNTGAEVLVLQDLF
jgi:hypothetical protein